MRAHITNSSIGRLRAARATEQASPWLQERKRLFEKSDDGINTKIILLIISVYVYVCVLMGTHVEVKFQKLSDSTMDSRGQTQVLRLTKLVITP